MKKNSTKVSCIIPAYNEGKRIPGVLAAVLENEWVDEVIVVDDGSTDGTKKMLQRMRGIEFISYSKNRGKSFAVMTGLKKAKNDLVLMLDSDLLGLTSDDVTRLVLPVLEGAADMSLTMRKNSLLLYKILGLDFVSGERVFHKKVLGDLDKLGNLRGFGLEVYINKIAVKRRLRLKIVYWRDVITPRKSVKFGWRMGVMGDLKMTREVISTAGLWGVLTQIFKMRALRV